MTFQIVMLFILALPIACIAWTITREEVFREFRDWCQAQSTHGNIFKRKFCYLFTCEYCFSHWVTMGVLVITRFHLIFPDQRGLFVAGFALVYVSNFYMALFGQAKIKANKLREEVKLIQVRQQYLLTEGAI